MTVRMNVNFGPPADPETFARYYVDVHAPLVRKLPGLRRYEYGRALANLDGSPPDFFWSITLVFDNVDAMHAAFASVEGQATIDDMPNFITGTRQAVVSEVL